VKNKSSSFAQQKYNSSNPLRRFFIKLFLKKVLVEIKKQKPANLLDIGCGEGQADKFFLEYHPNLKITGVDFDEQALKEARINCPAMKIKKADIYHLPFVNKSFDLILCLEVLEHLKNPQKAIKEIKRVGRYFILSVPHEPFFSIMSFLSGRYLKNFGRHPEHLNFWSKKSFTEFMKKEFSKAKIKISFPWLIAEGDL
jgi:ubiquinone/menaquinone biosynthesis C-methylase UbiE